MHWRMEKHGNHSFPAFFEILTQNVKCERTLSVTYLAGSWHSSPRRSLAWVPRRSGARRPGTGCSESRPTRWLAWWCLIPSYQYRLRTISIRDLCEKSIQITVITPCVHDIILGHFRTGKICWKILLIWFFINVINIAGNQFLKQHDLLLLTMLLTQLQA